MSPCANPIFVVGTGRSGTCWMGRILNSHPDIHCTIEVQPMFRLANTMAFDPRAIEEEWPSLIEAYSRCISLNNHKPIYADKSHPNLWHVERLLNEYPNTQFVGMARSPYQVVASMMQMRRGQKVNAWSTRWHKGMGPNAFLGIGEEDIEGYKKLSDTTRAAMRWRAHMVRLKELTAAGLPVHVVFYEELVRSNDVVLADLATKLGLDKPFPAQEVDRTTLDKWKTVLSEDQVEEVRQVTGLRPEDWPWDFFPQEMSIG